MFRVTQDSAKYERRFEYKAVTFYGPTFQSVLLLCSSLCCSPTTPIMPKHNRFGLFRVRSPLLTESVLFSFPPGTSMFQFPGLAWSMTISLLMGYPIRKSTDRRLFAPPRSLSQLITSFFASESQGIPHTPFVTFLCSFLRTVWVDFILGLSFARFLSFFQYVKDLAVENNGFEPLTPCVQSRCSSQLS